MQSKILRRIRRKKRTRSKIIGTADCPRLSVFRSNKHLFVQIIDDKKGDTIVSARDKEIKKKPDSAPLAELLGELIAEKAKSKGLKRVVFDRNGYLYAGMVKSVAVGARRGGLTF